MSKTFARASDHPLHWPEAFPRNATPMSSRFDTTLFQALENVKSELALLAKDSGKKLDGIV
ncbi:MAG: J domain-containing protein, partial [Gammaproteobacteria bacterium]|nr:J domain-containing protein [Gammaproteobacteria bacterium]MBU1834278.1 J domain-containing protein [Gammaproteobacteria bacterium]